jgi:hypothetical protein
MATSPDAGTTGFIYASTIILALVVLLSIIMIFRYLSTTKGFAIILWVGIPLLVYIVGGCLNLLGQYIACQAVDAGRAFKSSLILLGTTLIGLILSSITMLRLPIGSVFAQLFETRLACNASLIPLEAKYPTLKGISYGYYVMWGILFGQIMNANFSAACPPKLA